jgi:hypothetical protein
MIKGYVFSDRSSKGNLLPILERAGFSVTGAAGETGYPI